MTYECDRQKDGRRVDILLAYAALNYTARPKKLRTMPERD